MKTAGENGCGGNIPANIIDLSIIRSIDAELSLANNSRERSKFDVHFCPQFLKTCFQDGFDVHQIHSGDFSPLDISLYPVFHFYPGFEFYLTTPVISRYY